MRVYTRWTTIKVVAVGVGFAAVALLPARVSAATPSPPFIPPAAGWLTTINYYRAMAGVAPVVENATWSAGAAKHSCYMLDNGMDHDEEPGLVGYSAEGDLAGNNGNIAVSSRLNNSARSHIELWMSGPFHAIGVLRANLQSTGFGKCDRADTPTTWHSGATLDVIRGLTSTPRPAQPILFPGDGTTTNLDRFVVETPSPLDFCPGYSAPAGLPIIAMMPEAAASPVATLSGPSGPSEVCVLSAANTTGDAQQILLGDNAVVVVPRTVLAMGTYNVTVGTTASDVSWSFTVDPSAAVDLTPVPVAVPAGPATGFTALPPVRIVDTRILLGTSRLEGGTPRRIQVTGGLNGVPNGANAVFANVTVTSPSGSGFVTMWGPCSTARPEVSTVNFSLNETVANSATIPLDYQGGLCAFSNVSTDLVMGVRGYYSTSSSGRYMPVVPRRLMDSRGAIGTPARLVGGQPVELPVVSVAGVPPNASAVALSVTGVLPSLDGFVTAYPCGTMPGTSSLNPSVGQITANLLMAPVSSAGTVCFFSNVDVDLVVDVVGFVSVSPAATNTFTPSTPFRFTDTRDVFRPQVNSDQGGVRLAASQTLTVSMAGRRGIPATARAISGNLTVVDATAAGFVTAYPCGAAIPMSSNVNYEVGAAVASAVELPLSPSGAVCIYSSASAHVIIDVNGWWS